MSFKLGEYIIDEIIDVKVFETNRLVCTISPLKSNLTDKIETIRKDTLSYIPTVFICKGNEKRILTDRVKKRYVICCVIYSDGSSMKLSSKDFTLYKNQIKFNRKYANEDILVMYNKSGNGLRFTNLDEKFPSTVKLEMECLFVDELGNEFVKTIICDNFDVSKLNDESMVYNVIIK